MPRKFKLTVKRQIDGQMWPAGAFVTTSKYDDVKDKDIPDDLVEVPLSHGDHTPNPVVATDIPNGDDLGDDDDDDNSDPGDDNTGEGDNTGLYTEESLSKMDVDELKEVANKLRVDNANRMSKPESLVMAILSMQENNKTLQNGSTVEGSGLATPVQSSGDVTPV